MKVTRYLLATILTAAILLSCSEDTSQFPLINKRGDDGREFLYEWLDDDVLDNCIFYCTVSPDCSEVALEIDLGLGSGTGYEYALVILDLDSSKTRTIRDSDVYNTVWSTSGEWIAYSADEGPGPHMNIWLIRPDGSEIKPAVLEENWASSPLQWFNKDLSKLLFTADGHTYGQEFSSSLFIYELDTGEYNRITEDVYYSSIGGISPDDDWIAKSVIPPGGFGGGHGEPIIRYPLTYTRTDGADYYVEIRELITNINGSPIDWSPDGKYLLFSIHTYASEFNDIELWTYEIATGKFKQLTMAPVGYLHPNGSPNPELVWEGDWANDGYIYFAANGILYRIKGPA